MKEIRKETSTYEEIKDKINKLNINDLLKEELNNLNNDIYKIKKYNLEFNINIIINNCSKDTINIFLENINSIIKEYNINKKITNYKELEDIETNNYSEIILVINDYEYLKNEYKKYTYRYSCFKHFIEKNSNSLILTCEGNFEELYKEHISNIEDIINNSIVLYDEEYSIEELVSNLKQKYSDNDINYDITYDTLKNIIEYYINNKYCYKTNCIEYLYNISIKKMLLKKEENITIECFEKFYKNTDTNNEQNSLNNLIGLDNIKKEIESLKNYLEFRKKTKSTFDIPYLNMFFMGNPGTGKTTVAREIANILYELEYIEKNKVVEIIPTDLMANYVGQTKDEARKILNRAKGGLLFIDEAYLLCQAKGTYGDGYKSYMAEALVELLKYLENPKNVVIFAGYSNEMKKVYECNPGIKSRIYKEIYFDNYTPEELYLITEQKLNKMNMKISDNAKEKIIKILKNKSQETNFGNARFCEQYAQKLVINHANKRLQKENFTITINDVYDIKTDKNMRMGFIGD